MAFPDFISLDLETTGPDPREDRVIEVGLVRFSGGRVVERVRYLCSPGRPLPLFIRRLTGIEERELRGTPSFEQIFPRLFPHLSGTLLLYNASFDLSFLRAAAQRLALPLRPTRVWDALALARILLPRLPDHRLRTVARFLGVRGEDGFHRALADAEVAGRVFLRLLPLLLRLGGEAKSAFSSTSLGPLLSLAPEAGEEGVVRTVGESGGGYGGHPTRESSTRLSIEPWLEEALILATRREGVVLGEKRGAGWEVLLSLLHREWAERVIVSLPSPAARDLRLALPGVGFLAPREEYLCLERYREARRRGSGGTEEERRFWARVAVWLTETGEGWSGEMRLRPEERTIWRRDLAAGSGCRPEDPAHRSCFYPRAREKAREERKLLVAHRALRSLLEEGEMRERDLLLVWEAEEAGTDLRLHPALPLSSAFFYDLLPSSLAGEARVCRDDPEERGRMRSWEIPGPPDRGMLASLLESLLAPRGLGLVLSSPSGLELLRRGSSLFEERGIVLISPPRHWDELPLPALVLAERPPHLPAAELPFRVVVSLGDAEYSARRAALRLASLYPRLAFLRFRPGPGGTDLRRTVEEVGSWLSGSS